jgi:hypothetical protein
VSALSARSPAIVVGSKIIDAAHLDVEATVRELFDGSGAVTIRGLFSTAEIAEAREVVMRESDGAAAAKVTHFQGAAEQGWQDRPAAPRVEPAGQGRGVLADGGASGADGR